MPKRATAIGIIHHLYYTQNIKGSKLVVRGIGILEKLAVNLIKLNAIGVINPAIKSVLLKERYPGNRIVSCKESSIKTRIETFGYSVIT